MIKSIFLNHEKGLHCRPSVQLAQLVKSFDAKVEIIKGQERANASEVLQVLSLGVTPGDVVFEANGNDAERVLAAIEDLFRHMEI